MGRDLLKQQAIELRQKGYLYAHIAKELHVAKSTIYSWTYDIKLNARNSNKAATTLLAVKRQMVEKLTINNGIRHAQLDEALRAQAHRIVDKAELSHETKSIVCAALFWCEGGKDVASGIRFINSDPMMVRTFLALLRECFGIHEHKLRALVHLHEYHNPEQQVLYWSEVTGIPLAQFYRSYLKPHIGKNIHENYAGCVSIRYGDVRLGKTLKMIYSEFGKSF